MSGIVGVWNLDGRPLEAAVLARMSRALAHRGPDGEGCHLDGPAGFVCRHLWVTPEEVGETQPLVGSGGAWLVFDGRLDNREELLGLLDLPPGASDAACALAAYGRWGMRLAERLSGDFACAVYDPERRRLLLARDPMGVRTLYYHATPQLVAFAGEIRALLSHPAIPALPDEDGVADYLLPGVRPIDRLGRTCFEGIMMLPPAHVLVATPGASVSVERYWDFDPEHRIRFRTEGEYAEAFRERFSVAVGRRIRSAYPVVVSASGGLDSSSIFCQAESLRRHGAPCAGLRAVAYVGPEGTAADERAYLDAIEHDYGIRVERIPMVPLLGVAESAETQAHQVEAPLLDVLWGATSRVQEVAAGLGARRFITGHWGDQVLFSSAYLVDLIGALRWRTAWRHLRDFERWFTPDEAAWLRRKVALDLVRHAAPAAWIPLLKRLWHGAGLRRGRWVAAHLRSRVLRGAHRLSFLGRQFRGAHARALYLETRAQYHVQCMEWNNKAAAWHGLDVAFPFLDRDLVAFLLATPGEVHNVGGVPRGLMREAMRGVLPHAILARNWKADFTDPVNATAHRELDAIRARVLPPSLATSMGFVDPTALRSELDGARGRLSGADALASWDVAALLGLEAWLQVFFGDMKGGAP